jgi:sterol desaturase/sphingolipid hydroxylase (fatty acid hydroxylase superfamily)
VNSKKVVKILAYPGLITLGIALYYLLISLEVNVEIASYAAAIFGATVITFLEIYFPYRKEWLGRKFDVKNDSIYMVVQIVVPLFLTYSIAFLLVGEMGSMQTSLTHIWPNNLPVWSQVILMLLTADLLRYWLHRFSHEWTWLWRLHAVHHSPHKVYWLNVGRFHPLEKALQFMFDALPFILLGVSEEVLALYLVFYSINGFFQHCNIDVRLGLLNFIISGPELHRWHHSSIPEESNQNYGNNLIVWDLLFGTRFLPDNKEVGDLGLQNRNYPLDFISQLKTPFIKGIEQG